MDKRLDLELCFRFDSHRLYVMSPWTGGPRFEVYESLVSLSMGWLGLIGVQVDARASVASRRRAEFSSPNGRANRLCRRRNLVMRSFGEPLINFFGMSEVGAGSRRKQSDVSMKS